MGIWMHIVDGCQQANIWLSCSVSSSSVKHWLIRLNTRSYWRLIKRISSKYSVPASDGVNMKVPLRCAVESASLCYCYRLAAVKQIVVENRSTRRLPDATGAQ